MRWRIIAVVIVIAIMLAVIQASSDFLSNNWRAYQRLDLAILHMLPPWLSMAVLIPFVSLTTRRFSLISGARAAFWSFPLHMFCAAAFAAAHYALLGLYHYLRSPLAEPYPAVVLGLIDDYLVMDIAVYWAAVGAFSSIGYHRVLRQREVGAAELRASLSEARLQALHSQLHPHFLFNALNTVAMQVRQGLTTEAVTMLSELSDLLRDLLRDVPGSETTLAAEIALARRYLGIEQIRFGERLRVDLHIQEGLDMALVPPLILQPVVENAIRHGVSRLARGGAIEIRARAHSINGMRQLRLEVIDNGPGVPPDMSVQGQSGLGLRNTYARLAQLYHEDFSLQLQLRAEGGTRASITLPLRFPVVSAPVHAVPAGVAP